MAYTVRQGDIVKLNFTPQSGHEQSGWRPAVIVSNDTFHSRTNLALVCPITSSVTGFPLHIPLDNRTKTSGVIKTEQVKSLDIYSRKVKYVEKLPDDILNTLVQYVRAFV